MLWLYRFFCGYVMVAFGGNYSERLINSLVKKGVSVWHIKKKKSDIHACIFARDFKRLPSFKGKSGVKIHILNKTGMPFIINKYKHRPGILVGAIAFFVIIYLLSGFIWNVKVEGNNIIKSESIIKTCEGIGIYEGARTKNIDANNARVELMLRQKGLSWASVNIEGSSVTINVREITRPNNVDKEPSNLKSSVTGVVISTTVTGGDVCVKPGDTVVEGQLLVSGAVAHADGSTELVKSEGEVVVRTTLNFVETVDFRQTKCVRTGETKKRSVLYFFGQCIPLYLGEVKGDYQKRTSVDKIEVNGNYAPIYLASARFYETKNAVWHIDEAEALRLAQKSIEDKTKSIDGFCEISHKDSLTKTNEGITLKREYICQQNAAVEEILLINTFN